jgi:uncharacterized protein
MESEQVNFYSAGHKLTGYWYPPKDAKDIVPGIVCCHGFSGMIDHQLVGVPETLSDAGYAALTFYCRGIGESEGPRGRMIPWEQVDDIRNAITYMQTRAEVAPDRIGLFGSAFGCSTGSCAAAIDERAKCFVGLVGTGDCERWLKTERSRYEWPRFLQRVEEDRKKRVLTGESEIVHINEIHIPDDAASSMRTGRWEQHIRKYGYSGYPLETADAMLEFKPERLVHKIAPRAAMFIHMGNDITVPPEESISMYEHAGEPKRVVILEGREHYEAFKFAGSQGFAEVMDAALSWYSKYLPLSGS